MGARCGDCKQDMLTENGCTLTHIKVKDGFVERLKETWSSPGERCLDCGAPYGETHHFGCDIERCPICDRQMITCFCLGGELKLAALAKGAR